MKSETHGSSLGTSAVKEPSAKDLPRTLKGDSCPVTGFLTLSSGLPNRILSMNPQKGTTMEPMGIPQHYGFRRLRRL